MIVTNWTMRRFHTTTLLVLIFARQMSCLPIATPQPTAAAHSQQQQHQQHQQPAAEKPHAGTQSPPSTPSAVVPLAKPAARVLTGEEGSYFQGDIRLLPLDDPYDLYRTVFKRMVFDGSGEVDLNITVLSSKLWPDARIPYRFASHLNMEYRRVFDEAIHEWSRSTCLQFEAIGDVNITEEDYIVFTDTEQCSSYVGRIGGPQEVSIDSDCLSRGHAMHEIGHALGLWHEHSRWDRDSYIRIIRQNIVHNGYYNFGTLAREKWSHIDGIDDISYDLLSIMHYGAKSFSENGNDTIEIVVSVPDCASNLMGQRRFLSRRDKIKMSRMYHCPNETNMQDKCDADISPVTPTPSPSPTTPPPTPRPSDKLMNNDRFRLNTNPPDYESLFCTESRCLKNSCDFNMYSQELHCDRGFDFTIHHYQPRRNQKIKSNDTVNLQSFHKEGRWFECNGQNICSISHCPANEGGLLNTSNISECTDQRFKIQSMRTTLREGTSFKLKHESNDTYIYCTDRWCSLIPLCVEGEIESDSKNFEEVLCHTPTTFYVQKYPYYLDEN